MTEGQKAVIKLLKLCNSCIHISLWDYDEFKLDELKEQELIETAAADWNWFEVRLTSKGREVEID